jgi:hypothetical protein
MKASDSKVLAGVLVFQVFSEQNPLREGQTQEDDSHLFHGMNVDGVETFGELNVIHHRSSILGDHAAVELFRCKRDRLPAIERIVVVDDYEAFNVIKGFSRTRLRYEHLLVPCERLEIRVDGTNPPDLACQTTGK